MQVNIFVRTHHMVHLRFIHFTIWESYLLRKKKGTQYKYQIIVYHRHAEVSSGSVLVFPTYYEMHKKIKKLWLMGRGIDGWVYDEATIVKCSLQNVNNGYMGVCYNVFQLFCIFENVYN